VLAVRGQRQEQRLPRRVEDGVVAPELADPDEAQQREDRQKRDEAVADQRDERQHEQGAAHSDPTKQPADYEHLKQDREHVHRQIEARIELADEPTLVEQRIASELLLGVTYHGVGQKVVAKRAHAVQQHDEQRDEQQISVPRDQSESTERALRSR